MVVLHHHHLQHLHPHLLHPHHHQAVVVDLLNGKVTIIVMMKTTMQPVNGMVVIAVVMMLTHSTAQLVNVWTQKNNQKYVEVLNGKVTIIAMMTTTMQDVNGMEVIAVVMM